MKDYWMQKKSRKGDNKIPGLCSVEIAPVPAAHEQYTLNSLMDWLILYIPLYFYFHKQTKHTKQTKY